MARLSHDVIEQYLLQYLAKRGEPTNWYPIERSCRLPRDEFPEAMNIMSFLEVLKDKGMISETADEKGHPLYSLTVDGHNAITEE